jgi:hypothetical protein
MCEFIDVHPLALFNFIAASRHLTKPVRRMEDLAEMRIALPSKPLKPPHVIQTTR